jgi:hypothetical protein
LPSGTGLSRDDQRRLARFEDRHFDGEFGRLDPERRLHFHGLGVGAAPLDAALPFRNAMLVVPPPNRGAAGLLKIEMVVVDVMVWSEPGHGP